MKSVTTHNISHLLPIILGTMLVLVLLLVSCGKEGVSIDEQKKILKQHKITERINSYKRKKINSCRSTALERAENFVHEKMVKQFSFLMKDTIPFPEKPIRPPLPENLYLDTIGVNKIGDFKLQKK